MSVIAATVTTPAAPTFDEAAAAMRRQVFPLLADLLRREEAGEAVHHEWTALAVGLVTNTKERPTSEDVDAADDAWAAARAAVREGHAEVRKYRTFSPEEEAAIERLRGLNAAEREAQVRFQTDIAWHLFVTPQWQWTPRWAAEAQRFSDRGDYDNGKLVNGSVWLVGGRYTAFSAVVAGRIAEVARVLPLERGEKPPFRLTTEAEVFGAYLREVALVEAGRTA